MNDKFERARIASEAAPGHWTVSPDAGAWNHKLIAAIDQALGARVWAVVDSKGAVQARSHSKEIAELIAALPELCAVPDVTLSEPLEFESETMGRSSKVPAAALLADTAERTPADSYALGYKRGYEDGAWDGLTHFEEHSKAHNNNPGFQ